MMNGLKRYPPFPVETWYDLNDVAEGQIRKDRPYFDARLSEFVRIIPRRLALLERTLNKVEENRPFKLAYSEACLREISRLVPHLIRLRRVTRKEREQELEVLPSEIREVLAEDERRMTLAAPSEDFCNDLSIFVGEMIRAKLPDVQWRFILRRPSDPYRGSLGLVTPKERDNAPIFSLLRHKMSHVFVTHIEKEVRLVSWYRMWCRNLRDD